MIDEADGHDTGEVSLENLEAVVKQLVMRTSDQELRGVTDKACVHDTGQGALKNLEPVAKLLCDRARNEELGPIETTILVRPTTLPSSTACRAWRRGPPFVTNFM